MAGYAIRRCPLCGNALPRLHNRRTTSGRRNPQARCRSCKEYVCDRGHVIWWPSYEVREDSPEEYQKKTGVCTHPACVTGRLREAMKAAPSPEDALEAFEKAAALEERLAPTMKPASAFSATVDGYPLPERMWEEIRHGDLTAEQLRAEDREEALAELAGLLGTPHGEVPESELELTPHERSRWSDLVRGESVREFRVLDVKRRYAATLGEWDRHEKEVAAWWLKLEWELGMAADLDKLRAALDEYLADPRT